MNENEQATPTQPEPPLCSGRYVGKPVEVYAERLSAPRMVPTMNGPVLVGPGNFILSDGEEKFLSTPQHLRRYFQAIAGATPAPALHPRFRIFLSATSQQTNQSAAFRSQFSELARRIETDLTDADGREVALALGALEDSFSRVLRAVAGCRKC